jgi:Tfp pilus assembly protein PilV
MPRRRSGRGGFTMVEVMAAAAVMVMVISTSLAVLQRGLRSVDVARGISYASQIMQTQAEKERLMDWTTVSAFPASASVTLDSAFTSNTYIGSRFSLTRTVTTLHTGMLQITYTVTWKAIDGRSLSRSTTMYYGQNGLYDYVSS